MYRWLNCDEIIYEGRVETSERLNMLYDEVTRHYHVIGNLTAAMAKGMCAKRAARGAVAT